MKDKIKDHEKKVYSVFIALVLIALAITYAFFLIIPLLFVPIWAAILFMTNPGSIREKSHESMKLILPCVIAAIIVAPYLIVITSGKSVVTTGKSLSEMRFIYLDVQAIKNLIVFLLPSPLIIAGFWFAFKKFAFSRQLLFLVSGTVLCLMLSIFVRFVWYNSVKFSFILSFFFSFLFVFSVHDILLLLSRRWQIRIVLICVTAFLFATPVITEASYINSPWFIDETFTFKGRELLFAHEKDRNEAYEWLRYNTPSDTILLLPYAVTPQWDRTAHFISYRPVALSERSLFVIKDVYTFILPEYEKRANILRQFYQNPEDTHVRKYLSSLNRPLYVLIEEGYKDPMLEGSEFYQFPEYDSKHVSLVFKNDHQRIYSVQYNK